MRYLSVSFLSLSLIGLVGCKAIEAMDNTETMKSDLAAMKSTTSGMAGTTSGMADTTGELKRKASIGEGLKLIDAPENNREFTPPQAGLLAGAKLIAENMNSDELIKYVYARLKEISKTVPSEVEYSRGLIGGYEPRYVADFNRRKQVQLAALQAIAAQIPQPMIERIIQEQIAGGGGRFSDTAYALLMLRAMFINSFYLDAGVFSVKMDTIGKLREAYSYASSLQFIASLPFSERIRLELDGSAFLPVVNPPAKLPTEEGCRAADPDFEKNPDCKPTLGEAPNFNVALDVSIAKPWFKKIVRKIDREMPDELKGGASPFAREIEEIKQASLRYADQK